MLSYNTESRKRSMNPFAQSYVLELSLITQNVRMYSFTLETSGLITGTGLYSEISEEI